MKFIITPRIKDIEVLTKKIQQISPDAKFVIAHGMLKAIEMEKSMQDFYSHKSDILISTSIIESGIDIPRANTLIVNNADRFGFLVLSLNVEVVDFHTAFLNLISILCFLDRHHSLICAQLLLHV